MVRLEGLGQLKKIHLIGIRTRDLPACSIVPQPTTLPRDPERCKAEQIPLYLSLPLFKDAVLEQRLQHYYVL
jgi:hypothetical protein